MRPPLVAEVPPAARPAEAPRAAVGQPHSQVHAPRASYKDPVAWRPPKQRLQCRFIPYGCCIRLHKLVGVKEQKFILSQFWWPELKNKAPAGPRSPQRLSGRIHPGVFQPLVVAGRPRCPLARGRITVVSASFFPVKSVSSRGPLPACLCLLVDLSSLRLCPNFPLLMRTPVFGLGLILIQWDLVFT